MSRQLDALAEQRQARRSKAIVIAVEFGLERDVAHAGGELTGLSVMFRGGEVLLVVKAVLPAGAMVAFVGAEDFGAGLIKACREARRDKLVWRADKYGGKS